MFDLNGFVMRTILAMVGSEPDYRIMKYALSWYDRAVLMDEDMARVAETIDGQYAAEMPEEVPGPLPETDITAQ